MPIRTSAKAIIIQNEALLVIRCVSWLNETYYILPGGGQESGETIHQALVRECREELGVEVTIGPLKFVREYIGKNHEFSEKHVDVHQLELMFECSIPTHESGKISGGSRPDDAQTGIEWLPLASLQQALFFPKSIREMFCSLNKIGGPIYLGDVN